MTELAKLTWPEAQRALHARAVCLLPLGATEPHGPHLPLDSDVTIALAMARAAAARFAADGVDCVVLPALPFGLTNYTDGFAGWLSIKSGTLWALLEDVIQSLEQHGVRRIAFCNAHLEPAHVKVLRGVAGDHAALTSEHAHVVFPDPTRRRWAGTLGEEFASGDCHAGRYETSLVLAHDEPNVRGAYRSLARVDVGLVAKMQAGVRSFVEAGAAQAYCGDPASASPAEGRDLAARLAEMVHATAREAWPELWAK
ncbi:MAG: creatininase family protein [Planctomycetota bacterium]|nr:MAG: creatininase family protein [Planctomycetota bacterium]